MTQPDLFDRVPIVEKFTRRGNSIVPPQREELARNRRDLGIARVSHSAGSDWIEKAIGYVKLHAAVTREFLTEDVREMAEADGLAVPQSKKAWGPVMQRAAAQGVIVADGYAPAKSSNLSPKVKWRSLICEAA